MRSGLNVQQTDRAGCGVRYISSSSSSWRWERGVPHPTSNSNDWRLLAARLDDRRSGQLLRSTGWQSNTLKCYTADRCPSSTSSDHWPSASTCRPAAAAAVCTFQSISLLSYHCHQLFSLYCVLCIPFTSYWLPLIVCHNKSNR